MQSCHFVFACLLCCWLWPKNQVSVVTAWKTLWWEECQSSEVFSDWHHSAVCTGGWAQEETVMRNIDCASAAFTERESKTGHSYQEHQDLSALIQGLMDISIAKICFICYGENVENTNAISSATFKVVKITSGTCKETKNMIYPEKEDLFH